MPIGSPDRTSLLNSVRPLCPDIPSAVLLDFFTRMDQEYFQRFAAPTIAEHVRLAARLTPEHPCEIAFAEQPASAVTSRSWPTITSLNSP